ncbi:CBS domain-containing protein/DUF21 domain-containing protein, partial [Cephalotus follicularis]
MRDDDVPCCMPEFWVFLIICLALVSFAGVASGLAVGLLSFSQVDLEVLVKAGHPQDSRNAAKILPLVKNEHLLLCTLLIGKSLAMEALPVFLDSILPTWAAIIFSCILVVAFAEIIPQAVCSRHGLSIGAKLSAFVRLLLLVFFPITYALSKLLDWFLGKGHSVLLRRDELKTLVGLHGNEAGKGGDLSNHEITIITGALDLTQKTARDAMTPISQTFSLDINSKLDMHTMDLIMSKGHSRIPIYSANPKKIIGLILVKNLVKYRPEDETPIRDLNIRRIPRIHDRLPLYDVLNQFQKGYSHMAVVVKGTGPGNGQCEKFNISIISPSVNSSDTQILSPDTQNFKEPSNHLPPESKKGERRCEIISNEELESLSNLDEEVIGVITLADILKELLQEEILDETDEYVEVHNKPTLCASPGAASASHLHWRTPVASPLSSYHQTPILHSPISPYIQSPLVRPTLSASPGKPMQNPP